MITSVTRAATTHVLSRTPIWCWLPLYAVQGLRVRATTVRLPEAQGRSGTTGSGEPSLRLVVVGDSVAAGVGFTHHEETMTRMVADGLASRNAARVDWQVVAKTGLTAGGIADLVDKSELGDPDVVLMSVGANDTKDLHTTARFRRELADLLDLIRERAPRAQILVLGAAPMQILPALQGAIGILLGARSARLGRVAGEVIAGRPGVHHLPTGIPQGPDLFAADGFHPGTGLHTAFAELALTALSATTTPTTPLSTADLTTGALP